MQLTILNTNQRPNMVVSVLLSMLLFGFFGIELSFAQTNASNPNASDSIPFYSEVNWTKEDYIKTLDSIIFSALREKDTSLLASLFRTGEAFWRKESVSRQNEDLLNFRLRRTRFLLKYSKISSDSALANYREIYKDAEPTKLHAIQTQLLDYMATAFRSNGQMDKAFEYNQKEIKAARLSNDSLLIGRSLITELDIVYNSFPWPLPDAEFQDLVTKANYVIQFGETHQLSTIFLFGKLYLSKFYIEQEAFPKAKQVLMSISDEEALPIAFSKYEHLCEIAKQTQHSENYRKYTLEFKKRAYQTKRSFVELNANNYLLDYAMLTHNNDSAKYYMQQLERNLAAVDTTKYLEFLDVSYTTLAAYFKNKDTNKQLQYLSYSARINKIIVARQRKAYGAILRYKDEVADLETANNNLAVSNSNFRRNLGISIGLLVLLVSLVFVLIRKYKKTRARESLVSKEKERLEEIAVKNYLESNNKQRIFLDELKYVKADKNYVEFHTETKRIVDRNKLSAVLAQLPPNFIQVHRSFVINKNFIKSASGNKIFLQPSIEIPLSRTFKNKLEGSL